MMRRRNVTAAAAAAFFVFVSAASAADLPANVRQAVPVPPALAAQINTYVANQVKIVVNGDAKAAGAAREELCRQPDVTPGVPPVTPSADFKAAYVSAIKANLPALLKSQKIGDRLNGAIIITRVAKATNLSSLEPEIIGLMNDPSPAIALWGVKAARAVMPGVLSLKGRVKNQKLTENVVSAAKTHASAGAILQEAYAALDVSAAAPPVPKEGMVVGTEAMLALLEFRIGEYVKAVPTAPLADRDALNYLGRGVVYGAMDDKTKLRVVQAISNLMSVSADRSATEGGSTRDELLDVSSNAAGALDVQLKLAKFNTTPPELTAIARIRNLLPAQIKPAITAAISTVKAVPQFAAIQNPPEIIAEPTPEPAPTAAANGG